MYYTCWINYSIICSKHALYIEGHIIGFTPTKKTAYVRCVSESKEVTLSFRLSTCTTIEPELKSTSAPPSDHTSRLSEASNPNHDQPLKTSVSAPPSKEKRGDTTHRSPSPNHNCPKLPSSSSPTSPKYPMQREFQGDGRQVRCAAGKPISLFQDFFKLIHGWYIL